MPITGNLNQEIPHTNGALDNVGGEVSSTTTDITDCPPPSDPTQTQPVESTSMEPASDSLEGFKGADAGPQAEDEAEDLVNGRPKSVTEAPTGFQSAFAAFASASATYSASQTSKGGPEKPAANSDEVSTTQAEQTEPSVTNSSAEPQVSSAIDSTLVTTSGDNIIKQAMESGDSQPLDSQIQQISEMQQDTPPLSSEVYQEGQEQSTEINQVNALAEPSAEPESEPSMAETSQATEASAEAAALSEPVYFIQGQDAAGEVVTSIVDPNNITAYTDTVVYRQCMLADGQVETTIVSSGGVPQEPTPVETQQQAEPQQVRQL